MKKLISVLLLSVILISLAACNGEQGPSVDFSKPSAGQELSEEDIGEVSAETPSEAVDLTRTYAASKDGITLTVTTDKYYYLLEEEIVVTATVTNNRSDVSTIFVPTTTENSHQEVTTTIKAYDSKKHLIDTDTWMKEINCAIGYVSLEAGESYTQVMNFETAFSDDGATKAKAYDGVYNGNSCVKMYTSDNETEYFELAVDFSLVLYEDGSARTDNFATGPLMGYMQSDGVALTTEFETVQYLLGETITVTSTLKNNRDEDIYLYAPVSGDGGLKIAITHFEQAASLVRYSTASDFVDELIKIPAGESYSETKTFTTDILSADGEKSPAPYGRYDSTTVFKLCTAEGEITEEYDTEYWIWLKEAIYKKPETYTPEKYDYTVTEEKDGVILTVALEKNTFNTGDPITVKATVTNNRAEPIFLFLPTLGVETHTAVSTNIVCGDTYLPDIDILGVGADDAVDIVNIAPGKTFTQIMHYYALADDPNSMETYKFIPAPSGVYKGSSCITLVNAPHGFETVGSMSLEFEITVTENVQ